jgi:transcriptional regulator with GAF, ATPase, and Fis domain/Tfp pilus assembly protein PilF
MPAGRGLLRGRYRLEERLGEGAVGETFRARDLLAGDVVTVKLLHREDVASREALSRELRIGHVRRCRQLVEVRDVGVARVAGVRRSFLVTSHAPGTALDRWIHGASGRELREVVVDVLSALADIHARGLVHGDPKASNIVVGEGGGAVLVDLGCARSSGTHDELHGTPDHLAPEAKLGLAHPPGDLHVLGVALGRLLEKVRDVPPDLAELAERMRLPAAEDRPTALSARAALTRERTTKGSFVDAAEPREILDRRARFVGRADALASLGSALRAVGRRERAPRVLRIVGASGLGRTRLLRETKLAVDGLEVIEGRGDRGLRELVGWALDAPAPSSRAALVESARRLAAGAPIALLLDDADLLDDRVDLETFARALPAAGAAVLVVVSNEELPHARTVDLEPLGRAEIAAWIGEPLPEGALDALEGLGEGAPKKIARLMGDTPAALLTRARIERRAGELSPTPSSGSPASADRNDRVVLLVAAAGGRSSRADLLALGVEPSALDQRVDDGRLEEADGIYRVDPASVIAAADPGDLRSAHDALARLAARAGAVGRELAHAARGHDRDRARARFLALASAHEVRASPHAFVQAAEAFAGDVDDPAVACAAAVVFEAAGDPGRALTILARALLRRPPSEEGARIRWRGGVCALRRGDQKLAVARLRAAWDRLPAERREIAPDLALALVRSGQSAAAAAVIEEVVETCSDAARAELLCTRVFATSYLGRDDEAERSLVAAEAIDPSSPRTRFRLASARAFLAHRRGQAAAAADAFRIALEIAETAGLDDLLVPAALNCGTANHQAGDLGAALAAYERGAAIATAFGATSTAITLELDLGKLLADVGDFDRARAVAERARGAAEREGLRFLVGVGHAVLAEIASANGGVVQARAELARARALLAEERAVREVLEVDVHEVELATDADATRDHGALLRRAREAAAVDVEAKVLRLIGEARARRSSDPSAGLADLERAVRLAEASGQTLLVAEVCAAFSSVLERTGAEVAATSERLRARGLFERCAATLPSELRALFRKHPRRAALFEDRPAPTVATARPSEQRDLDRLRRLVAINRELTKATTTSEVLEATIDAAIELARAERGFLLLRDDRSEGLRVAVARNFDRERIGRSSLKFSREIARRVVERGEPVVAASAEDDPRFSSSRSVHAMRLQSILCVPVRADGVAGALYLDHRHRPGAFDGELLEIIRAFADQAAIALRTARLLEELRARNEELEAEREALASVAERRALRIEALERVTSPARPPGRYPEIVGGGPAIAKVFDRLDRVVETDVTVLVEGESGTGKELVARALHANGPRRAGPFLAINCGALPEALLEAELFGAKKGAFTGATQDREGLFVSARGGTLFLDELGEMPLAMQVKLLRVLQEREVRPLGATTSIPLDVRIVAATNRDLRAEVEAGRFREDLFYRVAVVTVTLPPLRERPEDLPALIDRFLDRAARTAGRPRPRLDRGAERALVRHPWPGNVRQLENVLTKAVLLADDGLIREHDLALDAHAQGEPKRRIRGGTPREAAQVRAALESTGWNVCEAARILQIPRATFYRKLQRYGLERP